MNKKFNEKTKKDILRCVSLTNMINGFGDYVFVNHSPHVGEWEFKVFEEEYDHDNNNHVNGIYERYSIYGGYNTLLGEDSKKVVDLMFDKLIELTANDLEKMENIK
jgi:hypothetical protein